MVEVAAVHGTANASWSTGYGYTGMLVAFIARQNPLAVIPVALVLGGISASGGLLQRSFGLPDATVNVLQGILFVMILASETFCRRACPACAGAARWPRRPAGGPAGQARRSRDVVSAALGPSASPLAMLGGASASARRSCSSAWANASPRRAAGSTWASKAPW